jgi:hypothetical protein
MRSCVGYSVLLLMASASAVNAQTVQLPSFSSFGVDTTVVVPDRGAASLGRNSRMATGGTDVNGIPRQRAIGLNRQTGGQQVMAQIHDPREADAALLNQAGGPRAAGKDRAVPSAVSVPRAGVDEALGSVVELERRRAESRFAAQRVAYAAFEKGRQAQAAGKNAVAAVYYRTAAKQADATLRKTIETELRRMSSRQVPSGKGSRGREVEPPAAAR